jgi:CSLREA domain-containing protein
MVQLTANYGQTKMKKTIICLTTCLIIGLISLIWLSQTIRSDTLTVSKTTDSNDGVCDADCSLREAISAANTRAGPDGISLPPGIYLIAGVLTITDTVAIHGSDMNSTIIDGQNIDRVFILGPGINVEISDVTIQNGSSPLGGELDHQPGGGIYNSATLTLTQVILQNNIGGSGGGIFNFGNLFAANISLTENFAKNGVDGGGIGNYGTLRLRDSTVTSNHALNGGGISSRGIMTVTNSLINHNENGGINNLGLATIIDSTISSNTGAGGLLHYGLDENIDVMTIINSTISDNDAVTFGSLPNRGGGITHRRGQMIILNSTISGNSSNEHGGGLSIESGTVMLNNVTMANNSADSDADGSGDGGGLYVVGLAITRNSLIAGNQDKSSAGNVHPDCSGILKSNGHNLLHKVNGCTLLSGTGDITNTDPLLGPLQDNGGASLTHALLLNSPAINAGNPALPGSGGDSCETTDQRGVERSIGQICDIGAYEYGPFSINLPLIVRNRHSGPNNNLDYTMVSWSTTGPAFSVPAIDKQVVYAGSGFRSDCNNIGELRAFDKLSLQLLWKAEIEGAIGDTNLIRVNDLLVTGAGDGLIALQANTGSLAWQTHLQGCFQESSIRLHEGNLYTGSSSGDIYALTTEGQIVWQNTLTDTVFAAPAVWENILYFVDLSNTLTAVEIQSGEILWQKQLTVEAGEPIGVFAEPLIYNEKLFVADYAGQVRRLSLVGEVEAQHSTGIRYIANPTVCDQAIIAANLSGRVDWLEFDDLQARHSVIVPGPYLFGTPQCLDDNLIIVTTYGEDDRSSHLYYLKAGQILRIFEFPCCQNALTTTIIDGNYLYNLLTTYSNERQASLFRSKIVR